LDDPESLSLLLQSLDLYRSINDRTEICDVLIVISQVSDDPTQRQACLQEALALARERGDAITMAGALDNLGILAKDLGNFSQARSWLEESLKIQRPLGAPGYVTTLQYLGEVTMHEGNFAEARAYFEEAVSMSKNAGLTANLLWSLSGLGDTALREGKWAETRAIFVEILRRSRSLGRTDRGVIYAVEALASVAAHENHPDRAARLFAFATSMRRVRNAPRRPLDQPIMDRELAFTKTQLHDSTFEALWAEGEVLTLERAVELALEENDEPIS
jgi:tetratricopeptide (TPR) repeat protein